MLFRSAGDIYQVPLMMNLLYDVEVVEDFRLSLGAGAGLQWTSFSSSSIVSSRYPGALLSEPDPMNPGMSIYYPVPLQIDASGQAISFRAQIQASLSYRLFSGVHLGAYIRYSGSSIADLGALTFQESPNNLYRDSGDIEDQTVQHTHYALRSRCPRRTPVRAPQTPPTMASLGNLRSLAEEADHQPDLPLVRRQRCQPMAKEKAQLIELIPSATGAATSGFAASLIGS